MRVGSVTYTIPDEVTAIPIGFENCVLVPVPSA
jgi:hypothetical protein